MKNRDSELEKRLKLPSLPQPQVHLRPHNRQFRDDGNQLPRVSSPDSGQLTLITGGSGFGEQVTFGNMGRLKIQAGWTPTMYKFALRTIPKKRLIPLVIAMLVGAAIPINAMWPNYREVLFCSLLLFVLMICFVLPMSRIVLSQHWLGIIDRSVDQLLRNDACDREMLKEACGYFPQDANFAALGKLPVDAPVPVDLLRRIYTSSPQPPSQISNPLTRIRKILLWIMVLAAIARMIARLCGK